MAETQLEELPLFPLSTVLFPYASVRIHVFEERYREMVRECLEKDIPFGIVLIRSGSEVGGIAEPYLVGTAVRIKQVYHFDDGSMDLNVQGERRFRIRELDDSKPYLIGHVEPLREFVFEETPDATILVRRAQTAFETWFSIVLSRQDLAIKVQFPADWTALSFAIANLLPLDNLEKQRFLESTDTLERFEELIPIIEDQILQSAATPMHERVHVAELSEWITPN